MNAPVELWGTGSPMRVFLHVDDLAQAVLFGLENTLGEHLYNVGTGEDLTIKELALMIQCTVGHEREIKWDCKKPDGTPKKLLAVNRLKSLGWSPKISLMKGIQHTHQRYKKHHEN